MNPSLVRHSSRLPQMATREADTQLPFGCRAGTCGTCVLHVVKGLGSLDEPGFVEEDTLKVCGALDPNHRLGCQLIVREGDIEVSY